ncbi:MAG TPA: hypothetical protein VF720_03550 [Candidatus Eisenbacteria bacterium]
MCHAARLTHETGSEASGRSGRPKNVQFSFMGLGAEADAGDERRGNAPPRILDETELAAHYAQERRRDIITWLAAGIGVLAIVGLLAWQIMRSTR